MREWHPTIEHQLHTLQTRCPPRRPGGKLSAGDDRLHRERHPGLGGAAGESPWHHQQVGVCCLEGKTTRETVVVALMEFFFFFNFFKQCALVDLC